MTGHTTHLEERLRADAAAGGGMQAEVLRRLGAMRDHAAEQLRRPLAPAAFSRVKAASEAAEAAVYVLRKVNLEDDSAGIGETMELIRRNGY